MRPKALYFLGGGFLVGGLATVLVFLLGTLVWSTELDSVDSVDSVDPEVLTTFGPDTLTIGTSIEISLDTGEVEILTGVSEASRTLWRSFQSHFMERTLRMTEEELWTRFEEKVRPRPGAGYFDMITEGSKIATEEKP